MREEEEANWFARWEEQLPTPEELTPLSQTLITPDLALALDILPHGSPEQLPAPAGPDEPARTLKRPRLVWTPQLHKRFVDAVAHLGIKNAVPKTIMQLMNVDGLTRENVASHLQKYRLYLKRMQGGLPSSSPAPAPAPADDHLFATAPLPHHFLARGPPLPRPADAGMPFVPVAALQHRQQMAAVAQHYYHQRHAGHMGSPPAGGGGGFEHGYLARQQQQQQGIQRVVVGGTGGAGMVPPALAGSYGGDLRSDAAGAAVGRRQELTLFPTGDD